MVPRADSAAQRRFDMHELRRVGLWGLAAAAALVVAVFIATSKSAEDRVALFLAQLDVRGIVRSDARRDDGEARKLADTVRILTADRDRLVARLDTLERNVSEITGSIARPAAVTPPPAQSLPAIAAPEIAPTAVPQVPAMPAEPAPTRPEFGVDLGGAASVERLRALWAAAQKRHGGLLDGLRPIVAIRETGRPGGVELRLVVGPLGHAAAAAKLCSVIASTGALCQPAMFEGQRLALR